MGVLYTWLVAAPLVVLTVRPTLKALLIQIATVGACVAVTAHAATAWGQLLPAAALFATAAAVHALVDACGQKTDGSAGMNRDHQPLHWPVLLTASAGASAGAWLATTLLVDFWQRRPPVDDITLGLDHWPMQAALALALPAIAGVCSLQTSGWRFSLGTVIVGGVWWGAASLVYPDHAGSLGTTGGWLAITWSIALGITACLPSRPGQSRTDHPDGHDARHSSRLSSTNLEGGQRQHSHMLTGLDGVPVIGALSASYETPALSPVAYYDGPHAARVCRRDRTQGEPVLSSRPCKCISCQPSSWSSWLRLVPSSE